MRALLGEATITIRDPIPEGRRAQRRTTDELANRLKVSVDPIQDEREAELSLRHRLRDEDISLFWVCHDGEPIHQQEGVGDIEGDVSGGRGRNT